MKIPYEVSIYLTNGETHELNLVIDDREIGDLTDQVVQWASDNGYSYDNDILNWEYRETDDAPISCPWERLSAISLADELIQVCQQSNRKTYADVKEGECFVIPGDCLRYRKHNNNKSHPTYWELLESDPELPKEFDPALLVQIVEDN